MNLLFSLFFAAGASAFVFSKFGRRLGNGNIQGVWGVVGVTFVITLIFFYTLMTYVLHFH